jgi:hypothetical protein
MVLLENNVSWRLSYLYLVETKLESKSMKQQNEII